MCRNLHRRRWAIFHHRSTHTSSRRSYLPYTCCRRDIPWNARRSRSSFPPDRRGPKAEVLPELMRQPWLREGSAPANDLSLQKCGLRTRGSTRLPLLHARSCGPSEELGEEYSAASLASSLC